MADDTLIMSRAKGRSASICATGSSSMEAIAALESTSNHNTPEGGTPTGQRRRRPAARSQSARIANGRSIRRRAAVAAAANHSEVKSHYNSEPKLAEESSDISPGFKRKHSTRRGTSVYHRKSTAFLEIPDQRSAYGSSGGGGGGEEDEDSYRLRSFSFTSKGIVNRGDSFRRRRSRSNSLIPAPAGAPLPSPVHSAPYATDNYAPVDIQTYTVALLGAQGVGKTALISQFMTSECINAYDRQKGNTSEIEDHNYLSTEATIERNPNEAKVSWTYEETKALIKSVETHYECLNHPVKRKHMWNNVSTDLESISILRSSKQCSDKWKNLLRTYKCCKDNNKKTGRAPTRFMYFDIMDDFLGTKPNNSCAHTIAVGAVKNNEVRIFQKESSVTNPSVDEETEVQNISSEHSPMNVAKKRKGNGNEEIKKKVTLEQKKLDEQILESKRKDERSRIKFELMKRKLDLEERRLIAFEKYINLKE